MLHILWRERSSIMSKTSSILGSLSQMIYDGRHVSAMFAYGLSDLGFLRRNLYACPQAVKEAAYKGLVRPVLEYSGSVWDHSGVGLQYDLEKVQNRAARFVTGNYNFETGDMTGILEPWKWESLKKRRRDSRHILLYKGLKGKASIPTDDLIPWLCVAGMIILWHIRFPLLSLIFRPLGIGMHFQTLLFPLLKVPRMVLLSSLLWWELGTNLPGPGPGEWLSFWRVTSKHFWFWPVPNPVHLSTYLPIYLPTYAWIIHVYRLTSTLAACSEEWFVICFCCP